MNKLLLLITFALVGLKINAQVTELPNGNVGVGISNPNSKLSIQSSGTIGSNGDYSKSSIYITDGAQQMGIDPNQIYSNQDFNIDVTTFIRLATAGEDRFRILNNGDIGVGTSTPTSKMEIFGNNPILKVSQNPGIPGAGGIVISGAGSGPKSFIQFHNAGSIWGQSGGGGSNRLEFGNTAKTETYMTLFNGKLGIGTTAPSRSLHVKGNNIPLLEGVANSEQKFFSFKRTDDTQEAYLSYTGSAIAFGAGGSEKMIIKHNGNIGIRTSDPKNELSVNGTIWAKEVKISLSDAADWVFDDGYKLKPLAELENYIKENKHLPEIPSAEEFRKNDLKVSVITNKLLQKIEELTLYTIEQNKKVENLQNENKELKVLFLELYDDIKKNQSN